MRPAVGEDPHKIRRAGSGRLILTNAKPLCPAVGEDAHKVKKDVDGPEH